MLSLFIVSIYYLNTWRLTLLTVGLSSHLADETGRRITFQKLSHELWAICVMPSNSSIALTPLSDDVFVFLVLEKGQVGNDQEKAQSERYSHSKNRDGKH